MHGCIGSILHVVLHIYTGSEMVKIGNGTSLSIHHIVNDMYTQPHTSTQVSLNKLLHVPQITKNLITFQSLLKTTMRSLSLIVTNTMLDTKEYSFMENLTMASMSSFFSSFLYFFCRIMVILALHLLLQLIRAFLLPHQPRIFIL